MSQTFKPKKCGKTEVGIYVPTMEVLFIENARRGLECNCICVGCNQKLIAAKGDKQTHHFKHYSKDPGREGGCSNPNLAAETATHLYIKQHIAKTKKICLPKIYITNKAVQKRTGCAPYLVHTGGSLTFEEVKLETRDENIIPDCIGILAGKRLRVEVKVTHRVDEEKKKKLTDAGKDCVELYVSARFNTRDEESFDEIILQAINYEWIYSSLQHRKDKEDAAQEYFKDKLEQYDRFEAQREKETIDKQRKRYFARELNSWKEVNLDPENIELQIALGEQEFVETLPPPVKKRFQQLVNECNRAEKKLSQANSTDLNKSDRLKEFKERFLKYFGAKEKITDSYSYFFTKTYSYDYLMSIVVDSFYQIHFEKIYAIWKEGTMADLGELEKYRNGLTQEFKLKWITDNINERVFMVENKWNEVTEKAILLPKIESDHHAFLHQQQKELKSLLAVFTAAEEYEIKLKKQLATSVETLEKEATEYFQLDPNDLKHSFTSTGGYDQAISLAYKRHLEYLKEGIISKNIETFDEVKKRIWQEAIDQYKAS